MTFSEEDKLKALAIVRIFETSKPFGNYAACVVLNDGAGVSYGISQFTHRSGSLAEVAEEYLRNGGNVAANELKNALPLLRRRDPAAIKSLSIDFVFRKALRDAAKTPQMRAAQNKVAATKYLGPAIEFCNTFGFRLPLSLAVVFDSITHGSFERVAESVSAATPRGNISTEKIWISEYVTRRGRWLASIPRLAATVYRTRFFANEIKRRNWLLSLPLDVHGFSLNPEFLGLRAENAGNTLIQQVPAVGPPAELPATPADTPRKGVLTDPPENPAETELAKPPVSQADDKSVLETAAEKLGATREAIDSAGGLADAISTRADSAKSLWTVVSGSMTQFIWAIFGFFVGLPRIVWIVVAVIAAALMLLYLYRQIEMGKIRETRVNNQNSNT